MNLEQTKFSFESYSQTLHLRYIDFLRYRIIEINNIEITKKRKA